MTLVELRDVSAIGGIWVLSLIKRMIIAKQKKKD